MKSLFLIVGAVALFAASAQSALAANWSAQDVADGECIAFFAMELGNQPEDQADPGLMAILSYFVGKVEGRHPGMNLTDLLTPDLIMRVDAEKDSIATRCSGEALTMGENMMRAGEALQALG